VDNAKIEEVVDNLVSNAIKFSLPGTTVKVRVVAEPDFFRIEVEDQGIGMSKEDMQNAFQRGMRLSARPTADEPSSGLGLWIVKRLVEAHEGTVTIRSDVGVGTTFTVLLPYRSADVAAD
jgi:signal transduction histidine kinase